MVFVNCLWVGMLAGLVGSRLIRNRSGFVSQGSGIAVGVFGSLLGVLADGWTGREASKLLHGDILIAALGATLTLLAWSAAQRLFVSRSPTES